MPSVFRSPAAVVLALGLLVSGCASSSSSSGRSGLTPNQIIVSELSVPVEGRSAYEVVQQYKSHWLRKRGAMSLNHPVPIKVYLDGTASPLGPVSSLRTIPATDVATLTRLTAQEAQFRFGLGNVAGAILVDTRPANDR